MNRILWNLFGNLCHNKRLALSHNFALIWNWSLEWFFWTNKQNKTSCALFPVENNFFFWFAQRIIKTLFLKIVHQSYLIVHLRSLHSLKIDRSVRGTLDAHFYLHCFLQKPDLVLLRNAIKFIRRENVARAVVFDANTIFYLNYKLKL